MQRIPKVTYDVIMEDLNLQPEDVAGLWASVQDVVHPDYWNPSQWKPGNRIGRAVHDAMRDCSVNLICKFLTQLTVGPIAQRNISATNRMKFLSDLSNRKTPPVYPVDSPNMPSVADRKRWEIRPLHYSKGYRSAASFVLIHRLSQYDSPDPELYLGPSHPPSKQQPHSDQTTDMIVDITHTATQNNLQLAGSIDNHDKDEYDKETEEDHFEVIPSLTMELSQLDEDYQNKKLYDSDSDNVHVSDNNNTQNHQDPNDIAANSSFVATEYGDDLEEENGIPVYRDAQTGRYFTSEYDPNEDPGMSMELEIPGEEILVTPEMLQRAEALCAE